MYTYSVTVDVLVCKIYIVISILLILLDDTVILHKYSYGRITP